MDGASIGRFLSRFQQARCRRNSITRKDRLKGLRREGKKNFDFYPPFM